MSKTSFILWILLDQQPFTTHCNFIVLLPLFSTSGLNCAEFCFFTLSILTFKCILSLSCGAACPRIDVLLFYLCFYLNLMIMVHTLILITNYVNVLLSLTKIYGTKTMCMYIRFKKISHIIEIWVGLHLKKNVIQCLTTVKIKTYLIYEVKHLDPTMDVKMSCSVLF